MATIQCKMCGGQLELPEGLTAAECPYCGSLTTFPKLADSQTEQLYNRAEQFRRNNDFDRAEQAYTQLIQSSPEDPEAYWGLVLSRYGIEYVEDPATHERIPTCHRVQYESVISDPDYLQALELASGSDRDIYEREAKRIEEIRQGILVISNQEKPYDVFICYKESTDGGTRTQDSVDAQEIYYQLTNQGYKVFFSRITLEGKLGQQYEPYIFAALNSSKVMLVIGSRKEYFESVWVRNEWSRFIALKKKNPSKLIIPCYKGMSPYDLPVELSRFQAQDMRKIGFIQDLIHGVKKVVDASRKDGKNESGHGGKNTDDSGIGNRLLRVKLFLENKEYETAVKHCEKVLDLDAENGYAYFYRLMGELRLSDEQGLNDVEDLEHNKTLNLALRFADGELKAKLDGILNARAEERRKRQEEVRRRQEMERKAWEAQQQRLEEERQKQAQIAKIRQESDERIGLLKNYMNCVQILHGSKSVLYATLNRCLESESALINSEEPTPEMENPVRTATGTVISQIGSLPALERKVKLRRIMKKGILFTCGLVLLLIVVRMVSCVRENAYINSELEAAARAKAESRWMDVDAHAGNILEKDPNHSEAKALRKSVGYIYDKLAKIEKYVIDGSRWEIYAHAKNILEKDPNHASAQYYLGICYKNGEGVIKDETEAAKWFGKAADKGNAKAQYELGSCYVNGQGVPKDAKEAVKWFRKAADQGDTKAQYELGGCYANGQGVSKDAKEAVKWYRKAADQGNAAAQWRLGDYYASGKGVSKNAKEAVKWYLRAADQGHADAQLSLGNLSFDKTDAAKWYRKAADRGNAEAQYELGACYELGKGVAEDKTEAVKWYRKAADQGYAKAQHVLGVSYDLGIGVAKDKTEAVKWYRKAADQGYAKAQNFLGFCYYDGDGVTKDATEAVKWFRKAAEQGNDEAQCQLGLCYKNGEGVTKDETEAVKWYRKAADKGNTKAQYELGGCYRNGDGVTKDKTEAVKWYRKAADQGNAKAQYALGWCYGEGWGVTKDKTESVKWFRKSAEQGYADAQYWLGVCYKNGWGVAKDYAEAVKWYRKAADQGDTYCQYILGVCYKNGEGVAKDETEAEKWFRKVAEGVRKSAEQGNANAQCRLGLCYKNGEGVTKDETEAVKWFRKSAEQGYADAQHELGDCYLNGKGVTKDKTEAVKWYRKAADKGNAKAQEALNILDLVAKADQGNADAQYNLGLRYYNGKGVAKNYTEAVKWFRKSAEQEYADAQYELGNCYLTGRGISKDYTEAVKWFRKSAKQGNAKAQESLNILNLVVKADQGNAYSQYNLGLCYYEGKGVAKNYAEAVKWFRKSADQGNGSASFMLGLCYQFGLGVAKDETEAVKWYRKSAEQGDAYSQYILGLRYYNGKGVAKNYAEAVKWFRKSADQGYAQARNMLEKMQGSQSRISNSRFQSTDFILRGDRTVWSSEMYVPPYTIRARCKTDRFNIRFRLLNGEIIFNWECDPGDLRLDIPQLSTSHNSKGRGFVGYNMWRDIEIRVFPTGLEVYVDGALRYRGAGYFRNIRSQVGIKTTYGISKNVNTVTVKSFSVEKTK